ncbi:TRPM8 channel-associated factor homolog [Cololabis saira]|uniref:TRPM8 channel-associated factor homolog n=1 Tax=Cololabis saira TaxID=129043 RepID=UPI002AD3E165|nr:TRPM8 channel-associated factor homolog [Cololabis saira]
MSNQSTQSYHEGAYRVLMRGLTELDLRGTGVPCTLELAGENAFPLLIDSHGQVLMAASLYGRGRLVVLSHENYLTMFPALVENALTWLGGEESENHSVGVQQNLSSVANNLNKSVFQVSVVEAFSENPAVGVYVTDAYTVEAESAALVAFLKAGGGVLIGGQAWHWSYQNPNVLLQFPGNKVSGVAGIYFSAEYGNAENLPIYPEIPSCLKAIGNRKDLKEDLEFLLKGISGFDLQGGFGASSVLVHGPLAFPIGITEDEQVFLAGTYYGLGRVIVATHETVLELETLAPFWKNAFDWLDQGRKGIVGFMPEINNITHSELVCEKTDFRKDLSVFVCTAYYDEHAHEIQSFVAEGGGLVIGGQSWNWAYSTHLGQNPLQKFPGNKILNKMGLSVLKNTIQNSFYKPPEINHTNHSHFRSFLSRFIGHVTEGEKLSEQEEQRLKKLGMECTKFLEMKAYHSFSYMQVLSILTDTLKKTGMPQVNEQNPVKNLTDKLLLSLGRVLYNVSPNQDALLPYLIKDNPSLPLVYNQRIKINAKTAENEEWISTGLYLSPGLKTDMIIPATFVNKNWKILIGCQSDWLDAEELKRASRATKEFLVTSELMQVWNLWGGLIYLVAPCDIKVEEEEVVVQVAVSAPYYKSGVTTADEWSVLRAAPSPWAELEFDNIILSVPSHIVRDLQHPDEVAKLWNDIMKGVADLAVIDNFDRKERIVADVQISHGWMHSGYPIMMYSSVAAELVRPKDARTEGLWGEIHELGHNQQRRCWEFSGHTTEATCNLWSVYVHEEVLGLNRAKAHPTLTLETRKQCVEDYVKSGRNLDNWHVWTALETYLQLQEKFGWDTFKKVFAAYHDMSDFPGDNPGKMNLYAETFSRSVGMNVTGFLKAWGWPIERATEEKLSSLAPWSDHPMVQYA